MKTQQQQNDSHELTVQMLTEMLVEARDTKSNLELLLWFANWDDAEQCRPGGAAVVDGLFAGEASEALAIFCAFEEAGLCTFDWSEDFWPIDPDDVDGAQWKMIVINPR